MGSTAKQSTTKHSNAQHDTTQHDTPSKQAAVPHQAVAVEHMRQTKNFHARTVDTGQHWASDLPYLNNVPRHGLTATNNDTDMRRRHNRTQRHTHTHTTCAAPALSPPHTSASFLVTTAVQSRFIVVGVRLETRGGAGLGGGDGSVKSPCMIWITPSIAAPHPGHTRDHRTAESCVLSPNISRAATVTTTATLLARFHRGAMPPRQRCTATSTGQHTPHAAVTPVRHSSASDAVSYATTNVPLRPLIFTWTASRWAVTSDVSSRTM